MGLLATGCCDLSINTRKLDWRGAGLGDGLDDGDLAMLSTSLVWVAEACQAQRHGAAVILAPGLPPLTRDWLGLWRRCWLLCHTYRFGFGGGDAEGALAIGCCELIETLKPFSGLAIRIVTFSDLLSFSLSLMPKPFRVHSIPEHNENMATFLA